MKNDSYLFLIPTTVIVLVFIVITLVALTFDGIIDKNGSEHFCDLPRRNLDRILPAYRLGCWLGTRSEK